MKMFAQSLRSNTLQNTVVRCIIQQFQFSKPLGSCGIHSTKRHCAKSKETDLVKQLRARIKFGGPMSVASYMKEVLTNSSSGYYMHRDVFGAKGDFITSPEISQMFGELLGVWCVHEWMECGSPKQIQIVELGPGRGTLADDMLRVFSQFKDIRHAISLHLVEISPKLSVMQRDKLTGESSPTEEVENAELPAPTDSPHYQTCQSKYGPQVFWYRQLADVPRAFSFFVAHEFLDALPIHKFQKQHGRWHEILIGEDNRLEGKHHLREVLSPGSTTASKMLLEEALGPSDTRNHVEVCPEGGVLAQELANRVTVDGGFALIADYGHLGEKTDTFRGFRNHELHDTLSEPGSADLTADVDFAYLKHLIADRAVTHGPITQEAFLNNMGIGYRLQALMGNASSDMRKNLITGYDMLTNPAKMGERFKFFAITREKNSKYIPCGFKPPT